MLAHHNSTAHGLRAKSAESGQVNGVHQPARCDQELGDEESRIRQVYEERKRAIPAERYSSSNPGNLCIRRELERHLLVELQSFGCQPLSSKKILDVGCGSGFWLQKVLGWGATPENLGGVDLLEDRIEQGRRELPEAVSLSVGSASTLNFADETFDLVLQFVVFSSILHGPARHQIAREMVRVLKPGGHVVWYDFFRENPWNPDVRGVGKKEIRELFPECRLHLQRITVAPPLARHMGQIAPFVYPVLASLKFCSTHYLGMFEKPL
jgi:ubiquinone/menaquinone biosynthesis C-methylase UbiE